MWDDWLCNSHTGWSPAVMNPMNTIVASQVVATGEPHLIGVMDHHESLWFIHVYPDIIDDPWSTYILDDPWSMMIIMVLREPIFPAAAQERRLSFCPRRTAMMKWKEGWDESPLN